MIKVNMSSVFKLLPGSALQRTKLYLFSDIVSFFSLHISELGLLLGFL